MKTTNYSPRTFYLTAFLLVLIQLITPGRTTGQCDTEVSGVFTYCNAVGTPGTTGYFVAFRVVDPTGDTLNVVDLNGNNITNRGKRIDDINTDSEPATVTIVPLMISGVGADTLEFWYFGPYNNGSTFNIALVDPNNVCDTVFVASGSYDCMDNTGISDPMACDDDVPLYFLDFSFTEFEYGGGGGGNETFDEIFLIMQRSRESMCCDLQPANQSCFEFIIRLGDEDIGLTIDDVGSGSPGGELYADTLNAFNCTGVSATTWPFTQSGGQSQDLPLCLIGGSNQEFVVLSCKSGGNETGASIDAITNIFSPPVVTIEPCNAALEVFNADTVVWSSPNDPNLDNLVSCTSDSIFCSFLYDTLVFGEVTECEGDTFIYYVGAMPAENECFNTDTLLFDTTYVIVYPAFSVAIDTFCNVADDSLTLSAVVSSVAMGCDYNFSWSTGDSTQSINVPFDMLEYSVTVTRSGIPIEAQGCIVKSDTVIALASFMIDCSNITDTLYSCINQLPDPDTTLVNITGCGSGDPLIYVVDSNNGGLGCVDDTLIITREYIVDFDGDTINTTDDQDTCSQLLLFVDEINPVLESNCPGDTTLNCTETDLSFIEAPVFTDNCTDSIDMIITFRNDTLSGFDGTCNNDTSGIIRRTWFGEDVCGNIDSSCVHFIFFIDSVAPSIICPADLTLSCTASTLPANTGTATSTDNCDATPAITFTDTVMQGGCPEVFVINRTWTASDDCNNTTTCLQVLTVEENGVPVITCPADITVECASEVPAPDTSLVIAMDDCGDVTITFISDVTINPNCPNQFTIQRTYQATDACGNSATCLQTITVFDDTPPSITCPANTTVQCASQVPAADINSVLANDNCNGTVTVVHVGDVITNMTCTNRFIVNRTYMATDSCGNTASCIQTITVFDDTPPSMTCPANVTVQCANQVPPINIGAVAATDNCGGTVTIAHEGDVISNMTCTNRFTITRTYSATDDCGNTATCAQIITVFDDIPPTLTCPADVTVQCASQVPAPNTSSVIVNDNCAGIINVTVAPDVISNMTCTNRFTITRIYTASDVCGNSATCAQTITVFDDLPPTLTCPADVTVQCASNVPAPNTSSVIVNDNCAGIIFVTVAPDLVTNMSCVNRFTITRVYTATDVCGNSATCAQTITVFDDTAPTITCPADVSVECTSEIPPVDPGAVVTSDNCGGTVTVTHISDFISNMTCANEFVITRTYQASDECGNTATCAQTITVFDDTNPIITCPPGITIECGSSTLPANTGTATATDNCGGDPTIEFADGTITGICPMSFIRTWTATDSCGNSTSCTQTITLEDTTPPVITCPLDVTISCTASTLPANTGNPAVTDNCDLSPTVTSNDITITGACPQEYTINRTWTATDDCGNSSTCLQIISVQDTTAPVIICPANVTVQCASQVPAPDTALVTASDDCGPVTITFISDITLNVICVNRFTITRTYQATDLCGNTSICEQTITVFDDTPPGITCPANITLSCASDVPLPELILPTDDNCGGQVTVSHDGDVISNMTCANRFTITRTYRATDECGNSSTCNQIITVFDDTSPTITCPANITVSCASNVPLPVNDLPTSDNCGGPVTISSSDAIINMTCANRFTINRTYMATDDCGNTATCLQTITVFDNTPPVLTCPADVTVQCASQVPPANPGGITGSDNCEGVVTITVAPDVISNMICTDRFTITRVYIATDVCGNTSSCAQIISVFDNTSPVITCPSDLTVSCANQVPPPNPDGVTTSDNCGGSVTVTHIGDVTTNMICANNFTIARTYLATDACGNTASCTQTIVVNDVTPPSISCPPDISINFQESTDPGNTGNPVVSDNCGGSPIVVFSDVTIAGECAQEYSIQRTWTATDECGNSTSCLQNIALVGGCQIDLALTKTLNPGQGNITGGDNVNFTITVINEGMFPIGSVTITDYIPLGFTLNDPDWTPGTAGSTGQSASIILSTGNGGLPPGGLLGGQSVSVEITLLVDPDILPGVYVNIAEISFVEDLAGNDISDDDLDSDPDENDLNDPESEDDHDAVVICIQPQPVIVGDNYVCPGDTVTYTVAVFNPANTYTWILQNGGGVIIGMTDSSVTIVWQMDPGGAFVIQLNEAASANCFATAFLNVFIQGDEILACNDHINLSIDEDCEFTLLSGMILEGEQFGDDNYIVIIIDQNGDTVPNATFTFEHVGQTFTVKILSECSGQSCWGTVSVEDKIPPQIICTCPVNNPEPEPDCEITCLEVDQLVNGIIPDNLQPEVVDNCGGATVAILDTEANFDNCEGGFIQVTWIATDIAGNTATCVQEFTIIPLTLDSLVFPPNFEGECGSSTHPDITGWPQVKGVNLNDETGLCNIFTGYWDKELTECGGGRKIVRTWTVLDWCTVEIIEAVQIIKLTDTEGPVLTCPPDLTVGTDFWYCYANVSVPKPIAADNCSDINTFVLTSADGIVIPIGNNFVIQELLPGDHVVIWTVTDECGNSNTCSFTITVVDNVVPVASCDEHTIVSLTNDGPSGITLVSASVFDDGSYDNCGPVTFRARRMESCIDFDWTTEGACIDHIPGGIPPVNSRDRGTVHRSCVPFACCDVGEGPVMVELEVTDAAGNVNYCMVEVIVQDKISPFVECPPDITVSCDFWFAVEEGTFVDAEGNNNGSLDEDPLTPVFGNMFDGFRYNENIRQPIIINDPANHQFSQPHFWGIDGWADDNCEVNLSVRVRIIDNCSGDDLPANAPPGAVKLIERRFSASDGNEGIAPGTCTQRIWIVDFNPFFITDQTCNNANPNDGVIWPCDIVLTTCPDDLSGTGEPIVFDDACSLIGISYEDTRFEFVDGACFKILREWKVIDWCQYDAATGYGLWSYVQVIKVHDHDGPEFLDCPAGPVELCVEDEGIRLPATNQAFLGEDDPNASSCSVHVTLSHRIRETCSETVKYDVKFYPFNGIQFIQLKSLTTITLDENNEGVISFNTEQSSIQSIRNDGLPYNSPWCGNYHRLLWTVEDGCGNFTTCEYLIRLVDCKQPSPVCINGLSTVVMPSSGQVTIWAKDFDASSFDDCTPADALLFSFDGDSYQPSFTYTCENVPAFGVELTEQIWVADGGVDNNCNGNIEWNERNKDFCTTTIVLSDNENVCDTSSSILAGEILTSYGDGISPVNVLLSREGATYPVELTDAQGKYVFETVETGHDYIIRPQRNDKHRNGVSTLDLVRIQKHLLGLELFTDPYQFIAADANNSQHVSAIDLVELRKLILGVYTELPRNTSWRFVDKKFEIPDQMNPWPFREYISIEEMSGNISDNDFIGIKIGDVNNSAQANAFHIQPRESRRVVNIYADADQEVSVGEIIDMDISIPEPLSGFQWTMETNGIEFNGITDVNNGVGEQHVGILPNGIITMSWNQDLVTEEMEKGPEFTISWKVTGQSNLSEMIRLTSSVTQAEAYTPSGEIVDIRLVFEGEAEVSEFALYQNIPNPWKEETVIGFDLPESSKATLTVYDVTGKIIEVIEGNYEVGHNTIILNNKDLPAPGVLYYRLESSGYAASKKMTMIR